VEDAGTPLTIRPGRQPATCESPGPPATWPVTERFWAAGLGLWALERIQPQAEGEHELVMLGWPGAARHLELVTGPEGQTPPATTLEDLLVLHLG
jgi:hypothetical protein